MKFLIQVPATSANLGPGFDALGLALDLWNETTLTLADEFNVNAIGEGEGRIATGKNNLIIRSALKLAARVDKSLPAFKAECVNLIPLSSGLGSSASAVVTGVLAGNALLGNLLSNEEILTLASELEGHPDNVAPALMGGLVVSMMENRTVTARQLPLNMDIFITVALPDIYLPTRQARAVLPGKISMKSAVHNISRSVLVTEAFRSGDIGLLGEAMNDKLHQPYRLKLIPGAESAMDVAKEAGASAVALSGAGPGIIAFTSKAGSSVGEAMKRAFKKAGLESRIFEMKISKRGAEIRSA